MNIKLDMVKAFIRGGLNGKRPSEDNQYMLGYEAGLQAVKDYIAAMERPIEQPKKVA